MPVLRTQDLSLGYRFQRPAEKVWLKSAHVLRLDDLCAPVHDRQGAFASILAMTTVTGGRGRQRKEESAA